MDMLQEIVLSCARPDDSGNRRPAVKSFRVRRSAIAILLVVLTVTAVVASVLALIPAVEDLTFVSTARAVDLANDREVARVQQAVAYLSQQFDENTVCLACPHANLALRCIVWPDGGVYYNPEVLERGGGIKGIEYSELHPEVGGVVKTRSERILVRHTGRVRAELRDNQAACVEHMLDVFDGVPFAADKDEAVVPAA